MSASSLHRESTDSLIYRTVRDVLLLRCPHFKGALNDGFNFIHRDLGFACL